MTYEPIPKRLSNNITKIASASSMQQYGNVSNAVGCSFHEGMVERYDLVSANNSWKYYVYNAFDGRYVYYIRYQDSTAAVSLIRYDSSLPYNETASWTSVALSTFDSSWVGYSCMVFDGRYMYMIPWEVTFGSVVNTSTILRYDTTQSFTATASWTGYALSSVNTLWNGFTSAVFDGKYLYMVTYSNGSSIYRGLVVRYDTTLPLNETASWTSYAVSSHGTNCVGFVSTVFDGRYVYAISFTNGSYKTGNLIRYDTTQAYDATASWSVTNLTGFDGKWKGFYNLVFDSQYVYMIPFLYDDYVNSANVTFVRYDTSKPFSDSASYESFDVSTVNAGYGGYFAAVYDGRYLYGIPYFNSPVAYSGNVVRYDTTKPFTKSTSWGGFDLAASTSNATYKGFRSGCFDGKYIYLVPYYNGVDVSGTSCRIRVKPFNVFQEYQL